MDQQAAATLQESFQPCRRGKRRHARRQARIQDGAPPWRHPDARHPAAAAPLGRGASDAHSRTPPFSPTPLKLMRLGYCFPASPTRWHVRGWTGRAGPQHPRRSHLPRRQTGMDPCGETCQQMTDRLRIRRADIPIAGNPRQRWNRIEQLRNVVRGGGSGVQPVQQDSTASGSAPNNARSRRAVIGARPPSVGELADQTLRRSAFPRYCRRPRHR